MHIWKETFANRRPVNVNVNINYSYLIVNIDGFIRLWTLFIFVRIVIVEINKLFQALFKKNSFECECDTCTYFHFIHI